MPTIKLVKRTSDHTIQCVDGSLLNPETGKSEKGMDCSHPLYPWMMPTCFDGTKMKFNGGSEGGMVHCFDNPAMYTNPEQTISQARPTASASFKSVAPTTVLAPSPSQTIRVVSTPSPSPAVNTVLVTKKTVAQQTVLAASPSHTQSFENQITIPKAITEWRSQMSPLSSSPTAEIQSKETQLSAHKLPTTGNHAYQSSENGSDSLLKNLAKSPFLIAVLVFSVIVITMLCCIKTKKAKSISKETRNPSSSSYHSDDEHIYVAENSIQNSICDFNDPIKNCTNAEYLGIATESCVETVLQSDFGTSSNLVESIFTSNDTDTKYTTMGGLSCVSENKRYLSGMPSECTDDLKTE